MDWAQVLTILGTNLALFIWARTEAGQDRRQFLDLLKGIQDEMKEFHGRLERQDAEFKSHLLYEHGKGK